MVDQLITARKIDYLHYCHNLSNTSAILCITVTKIDKKIDDVKIAIPGYSLCCHDRNRRGRGKAIYSHCDIPISVITIDSTVEHCIIRVSPIKGFPLIVCSVYHPPSCKLSKWQSEFHVLLDRLISGKLPIVVIVDLNVNLLSDGTFF